MSEQILTTAERVSKLIKETGLPIVTLLFIAALVTGWFPFVVCDAYKEQYALKKQQDQREAERLLVDKRIAAVLEDLSLVVRQINTRNSIVDCARIGDASTRMQCLEVVKVITR